jgi:hypothetical protein
LTLKPQKKVRTHHTILLISKLGFRKHSANLAKAATDEDKAKAMIGVEFHQALCSALGINA